MRVKLANINLVRKTFKGIFERYGVKTNFKGYSETTILLKDITDDNNKIVADHIWFNLTKGFEALGELKTGEIIIFDARVKPYIKGYKGRRYDEDYLNEHPIEQDYKLSNPTKIKKKENNDLDYCPNCNEVMVFNKCRNGCDK
jgi:hypothetical protein